MATVTFGAGCFWGVEAAFRALPGVKSTRVGYAGGTVANPTYEEVCTGRTGHAEVVQVEFNSAQVSNHELLNLFWSIHDPTTLNGQGPDTGTQYRSVIFYATPEEENAARTSLAAEETSGRFPSPIVTEICAEEEFFLAEDYHQQYFEKSGRPRFP